MEMVSVTSDKDISLSEYVSCFIGMLSRDIAVLVGYDDSIEGFEFIREEGRKLVVSFSFLGLEYVVDDYVHAISILNGALTASLSDRSFQQMIEDAVDPWDQKRMW